MNATASAPASGVGAHRFLETRWSIVSRAQGDSIAALESLCAAYRRPLLVWCIRRGERESGAEDKVQGFLAHLLRSRALDTVDRQKGRFRTFLLTAFQNYLRDQQRHASAAKRGGGFRLESLDEMEEAGHSFSTPDAGSSPDEAFDRAWADAVLENALRRLHEECATSGRAMLAHRLEGGLFGDETAPCYAAVAAEFGMSEGAVKTAIYRMRRRLSVLIREEVSKTLSNESEWMEELAHLRSLFGGRTRAL